MGQITGATPHATAGIEQAGDLTDLSPAQHFLHQIYLRLAVVFVGPSVRAIMTMVHVFAPGVQPNGGRTVIKMANALIQGIIHKAGF